MRYEYGLPREPGNLEPPNRPAVRGERMTPIRALIVAGTKEEAGNLDRSLREAGFDARVKRVEDALALSAAIDKESFDLAFAFHPFLRVPLPEILARLAMADGDLPLLVVGEALAEADIMDLLRTGVREYLPTGHWKRLAWAAGQLLDQARLRSKERRLGQFVQGSSDGFWEWHVPSGHLHVTPRWTEMLGYEPGDLEPRFDAWRSLIHPEDWPSVWDHIHAHLEGRTPSFETEHRMRTKSGDWCWTLTRGKTVVRDAKERPLRVAGSQTDNTERRAAEEELWRSQAELSAIYNHAPLMMLLVDDQNRIRRFNQAIREFTGLRGRRDRGQTNRRRPWLRVRDRTGLRLRRQRSLPGLSPESNHAGFPGHGRAAPAAGDPAAPQTARWD